MQRAIIAVPRQARAYDAARAWGDTERAFSGHLTAIPTAAVVLALCAQVAQVQLWTGV